MLIYLTLIDNEEDKKKFSDVYSKNRNIMFHVALSILKNETEAEDAVHSAFMRIAEKFDCYNNKSTDELSSLCIVITKHIAIDILRKNEKISELEVENLVLIDDNLEYQPENCYIYNMEQKRLHDLMNKLPENSKIILELKYYQNLNNKEIAQLLNLKSKTVELKIYRAKEKLKHLLLEENCS